MLDFYFTSWPQGWNKQNNLVYRQNAANLNFLARNIKTSDYPIFELANYSS